MFNKSIAEQFKIAFLNENSEEFKNITGPLKSKVTPKVFSDVIDILGEGKSWKEQEEIKTKLNYFVQHHGLLVQFEGIPQERLFSYNHGKVC